jgi:hypothetical protein
MDERMRRQWAATEAQSYGRGGVSAVSSATGMSRNTIRKGLFELAARKRNPRVAVATRIRKQGGGRKRLTETDPGMAQALDRLIEPTTRGDPMSPLRWTCKSTMNSCPSADAPWTSGRRVDGPGDAETGRLWLAEQPQDQRKVVRTRTAMRSSSIYKSTSLYPYRPTSSNREKCGTHGIVGTASGYASMPDL